MKWRDKAERYIVSMLGVVVVLAGTATHFDGSELAAIGILAFWLAGVEILFTQ